MAFVVYSLRRKEPFFRYLFLSMMLHLGILLASKIIIFPPTTNPEDYQLVVKIMDMPEQPKIAISKPLKGKKTVRTRKLKRVITKAPISEQALLKHPHPILSFARPKLVIPPAVLEKPILPSLRYETHIPQNFLKEGEKDLLHPPQITYKEAILANPKDIGTESTVAGKTGQIPASSHSPSPYKSGQGKEISGLIAGERDIYGFKPPAKVLAIGDSLRGIKTPLIGNEYIPLDSKDPDLAPYLVHIKERILQFWQYPEEAQPGLKAQINLTFTVERDGNVSEINIVSPSKYKVLDKGVLEAIKRAAPFKPIPLEIKEKRLPLLGTFLYNKPG